MAYYTSQDFYTRPYRIPAHTGSVKVPSKYILWNNCVYEGNLTEYIAYRQGLPVTRVLVENYLDDLNVDEELGETKSLGNVIFSCNDNICDTEYDLSTLSRHFHLLNDMLSENILPEKDGNGNYVLPLPFSKEEVEGALSGLRYMPGIEPGVVTYCYRCLQYLRPRDTAYYMRYHWQIGEKGECGLCVGNGQLTLKETKEFMMEVSHGLDDDTRAYLGKYIKITSSLVLGPLVSHILRDIEWRPIGENGASLLAILLAEKPSVYLALMCSAKSISYPLVFANLRVISLNDQGEGLIDKDWIRVQKILSEGLTLVPDWQTYLRVVVILGWGEYFPKPENFNCPDLGRYGKLPTVTCDWMTDEMKGYLEAASKKA